MNTWSELSPIYLQQLKGQAKTMWSRHQQKRDAVPVLAHMLLGGIKASSSA